MTSNRSDDDRPRRRSPGPRRRLTRDGIVDTAISVIETDGLAKLSMRRIADELGVSAGTLYTYVTDRNALLTLVLDTVVARDTPPHQVPGSWRDKLEHWAREDFRDFCARPWVLDLRWSVRDIGPNMLTWFDSVLRVFDGFDVSEGVKVDLIATLDAYIIGSAYAHLEAGDDRSPSPDMEQAIHAAYREATALQRALGRAPRSFDTDRFEFGLKCLLDGFAAALDERGGG